MSFMDDKKEVLTIELTQYGRQLLAKGQFKPEYYSFFDEDIVYDSSFAGISEEQSDTAERILQHSIILKPQKIVKQKNLDDTYILDNALGTSETNSQLNPSWETNISNTKIQNVQKNTNVDKKTILSLDDVKINYLRSDLSDVNNKEVISDIIEEGNISYYYAVEDPSVMIELYENNVDNIRDNFNFELFTVETANNIEKLEKLNFIKTATNIKNGILFDSTIDGVESVQEYTDETTSEYYFIIEVDSEIQEIETQDRQTSTYTSRITNGEPC